MGDMKELRKIWDFLVNVEGELEHSRSLDLMDGDDWDSYKETLKRIRASVVELNMSVRQWQLETASPVSAMGLSLLHKILDAITDIERAYSSWRTNETLDWSDLPSYLEEPRSVLVDTLRSGLDQTQTKLRDADETPLSSSLNSNRVFGTPSTDNQYQCDIFMIMPFREAFQPVYDDHIKPVVEGLNLIMLRGDDAFSRQSVMNKIWSQIHSAQLVIAECTGKNPNVFYELGIAHTLDKPVIMITQEIDDIPFDIRHLEVIPYEYTPPGTAKLMRDLKVAIEKLLST